MHAIGRHLRAAAAAAAAVATLVPLTAHATPARPAQWVAAWGATVASSQSAGPANATVRSVARVTLDGSQLRVRLTNPDPSVPLVVGAATIALQRSTTSPAVVSGTLRPLTFGGRKAVTLRPKTDDFYSDPVRLPVRAMQNVVVSLYLPAAKEPGAYMATWNSLYTTGAGAGNRTRSVDGGEFSAQDPTVYVGSYHPPLVCNGCNTYAVSGVDVLTRSANGAVVGLGSSTFHGYNSDPNRWNSVLYGIAARINHEVPNGQRKGIVNEGLGADTLHAALSRLQRDVFSQTAVSGVILYDLNDIGTGGRTADQIENDYRYVVRVAHPRGIRVYCPTWPPESTMLRGEPAHEREKLNAWILNSGVCDDVVDWAGVVTDPEVPYTYMPDYESDTIHPNSAGHRAMANATPMRWFTLPLLRRR